MPTRIGLSGASRDKLDPILDICMAVYKEELNEDAQVDFKGKAKAFTRTYDFLVEAEVDCKLRSDSTYVCYTISIETLWRTGVQLPSPPSPNHFLTATRRIFSRQTNPLLLHAYNRGASRPAVVVC